MLFDIRRQKLSSEVRIIFHRHLMVTLNDESDGQPRNAPSIRHLQKVGWASEVELSQSILYITRLRAYDLN
jgi:hypothetical protein